MQGALARRESRGCHNRTDFPELDRALQVNFYNCLGDDERLADPWSEPVPPIRDELVPWLDRAGPGDLSGHLLE
jgi:succinate dehydrogenase / fumarate reductase flavoprotein subunit